jgi:hypothetical protein
MHTTRKIKVQNIKPGHVIKLKSGMLVVPGLPGKGCAGKHQVNYAWSFASLYLPTNIDLCWAMYHFRWGYEIEVLDIRTAGFEGRLLPASTQNRIVARTKSGFVT